MLGTLASRESVADTGLLALSTVHEYQLAMASRLLSRLCHFEDAAFTLPETQVLVQLVMED